MKVRELIEQLQNKLPEADVVVEREVVTYFDDDDRPDVSLEDSAIDAVVDNYPVIIRSSTYDYD